MKQASRTRTFLQISNTANNETPDAELMRKELGAFICHAIDDLQPRLREPFLLHFVQEKSYQDIAQHLKGSGS